MAKSPQNNPAAPGPQCLVEASAGTGKTRAILDRAAALVKSDAALGMSQLVAITFTEKAAAELKYKLRQRLEKDSRDESISPSERANLQKALAGFDQAEIATIHSFCARLLRLRPVEAELSPAFEVIDSAGRDFSFPPGLGRLARGQPRCASRIFLAAPAHGPARRRHQGPGPATFCRPRPFARQARLGPAGKARHAGRRHQKVPASFLKNA